MQNPKIPVLDNSSHTTPATVQCTKAVLIRQQENQSN
jgi:hypothetical protein